VSRKTEHREANLPSRRASRRGRRWCSNCDRSALSMWWRRPSSLSPQPATF